MHVSGIEKLSSICREVSVVKGARWIKVAIERAETSSMDRNSYIEAMENAIKSS